jgi:UDP:flavonoid glycosyltransferase YjiC (YdhE family)
VRVALVVGPDPGHLVPIAGLATALRGAGHEVLVVTSDRWRKPLERDGLAWAALPGIAAEPGDADLGHRLYVRPVQMGLPLAAALRGLGLDLVVSDTLTRAGAVAATVLDLPWVELIPHPLPDPSVALPPFGTGWSPRPRRDRRYAARTERSRAVGRAQKRAALAAAGLADVPPAHRLVTTLPALEPARPDWPVDTTVVAPPTWEPAEGLLEPPGGGGPLLLVVGSTASAGAPVDLLAASAGLTAGWRVVSPRFGPPPADLPAGFVAGPGRLGPLLTAADAVLAAGGHGMVAAALRAGVPMVLVPGAGDQKEIAARAARVGAAVRLDRLRGRALARALRGVRALAPAAAVAGDVSGLPDPVPVLAAAAR